MQTLSFVEKTRLDQLIDRIVAEVATVGEKLEVIFWSKKYTANLIQQ